MRAVSGFDDYELIDTSGGERLERWKDIILIRPDPQIIWNTERTNPLWNNAHARYHRSSSGGGAWERYKKVPDVWTVRYRDLRFNLKPMGFKHTGLFPEQAVNWDLMSDMIKKSGREVKVLNLFGYTGAATLACAAAGASVTMLTEVTAPPSASVTTSPASSVTVTATSLVVVAEDTSTPASD